MKLNLKGHDGYASTLGTVYLAWKCAIDLSERLDPRASGAPYAVHDLDGAARKLSDAFYSMCGVFPYSSNLKISQVDFNCETPAKWIVEVWRERKGRID